MNFVEKIRRSEPIHFDCLAIIHNFNIQPNSFPMQSLRLKGSEKTPHFYLNPNGEIRFGGVSMPEDAATFYFDIMDWISDYYRSPNKRTDVTVSLVYINSSSSSMIFKIFHALKRLQESGKSMVSCNWYYEEADDNMKDFIANVQDLADNIAFKIHPTDNILVEQ